MASSWLGNYHISALCRHANDKASLGRYLANNYFNSLQNASAAEFLLGHLRPLAQI